MHIGTVNGKLLNDRGRARSLFLILPLVCGSAFAQSSVLTLSSGSVLQGGSVALNLSLTSTAGNEPSGLQFVLTFPTADILAISAIAAPSATTASKSISCAQGAGSYFCSVSGLNTTPIQNGVVAVVTVTPSLTVSATTIGVTNTMGASAYGNDLPVSGVGATVSVLWPSLTALSCNPTSLNSGAQSTCTVTLSQAAPTGGDVISLSSNSTALTVPASVTIGAGSKSATFAALAGTISANQTAAVKGTLNATSQTAAISLVAPTGLTLSCTPTTLASGAQSTCTVTLSQAAGSSGASVTLSSNVSALSVPASVTVAGAAVSATFTATASTVGSDQTATVAASFGGSSANTNISLVAPVLVSSLACNPASLTPNSSSTCTVTLNKPAPAAGASITLTDNSASLTVPASVTVAGASTSATFAATTTAISTDQSATVTAAYNGGSTTATIGLVAPVVVSSLTCSPASLGSNASSTCTLNLSKAAPSGGASVVLTDNNALVSVPASVTVAAAATSVTFTAKTGAISSDQSATVTAAYNNSSVNASISLTSSALVSSLTCSPSSLGPNSSSTCTVTLTKAAPAAGASVTLADNSTSLSVPTSVTVSASATSATFSASVAAISSDQNATVTASYGGTSVSTTISLVAPVSISSVACNPTSLGSNTSSTCTVTLTKAASNGGASVTLTDNSASLSVPASVLVAAGATSATFAATTATISSNQNATITASYNGGSSNCTIKLMKSSSRPKLVTTNAGIGSNDTVSSGGASSVADLFCTPSVLDAGAHARCELRVGATALPGEIRITSSSEQVKVPATVRTRASQDRLSFQVTADATARQQVVTVAATAGSDSVEQTFQIAPATRPILAVPDKQLTKKAARVRFAVAAVDATDLPVVLSASDLPGGASFDPASGIFEWTPTQFQAGEYKVTFTATNVAGRSSSEQVAIEVTSGNPTLTAAEHMCSPGAIGSVTGAWLAEPGSEMIDSTGQVMNLGGTQVKVNGESVPVLYASPTAVRFLCPALTPETQFEVAVGNAAGVTGPLKMVMQQASPWVFSLTDSSQGQGLVSFVETTELAMARNSRIPAQPAQPGDKILIWGSGFTRPTLGLPEAVSVQLGGVNAEVESIRSVPGQAGVNIVQVRVPATTAFGDAVPLQIQVTSADGELFRSNPVTIAVEPVAK